MTKNAIFVVFLVLFLFAHETFSKNVTVGWTKEPGSSQDDWANGIVSSVDGFLYVTGDTSGGLNGETIVYAGRTSSYVMKLDSSGSIVWTKLFGSNVNYQANSITVSADGLFLFFTGSISQPYCGVGFRDCGLLLLTHKLRSSDGSLVWKVTTETVQNYVTRQLTEKTIGLSIAVTPDGSSVLVSGYTDDILTVGSTNAGNLDIIIVKYNSSDGSVLWIVQNGGLQDDQGNSIAVSADGLYAYVAGTVVGNLNGATAKGGWDIALIKYDILDGNCLWTRLEGSLHPNPVYGYNGGSDYGNGVAVSVDGFIYVSGSTSQSLNGQPFKGSWDIFLMKFDATGLVVWTRQAGSNNVDEGIGVTVDRSGANISIVGKARGGFHNQGYYSSTGSPYLAMLHYASNGDHLTTSLMGQKGSSVEGRGITTLPNGNVYVAGQGSFLPGGPGLNGQLNHGGRDTIIVEFAPLGPFPTSEPTMSPLRPSLRPSNAPSLVPPTLRPSQVPSTFRPSLRPSNAPSEVPSTFPTATIVPQGNGKKNSVVLPAVLGSIGCLLCCILLFCCYRRKGNEKVAAEKISDRVVELNVTK